MSNTRIMREEITRRGFHTKGRSAAQIQQLWLYVSAHGLNAYQPVPSSTNEWAEASEQWARDTFGNKATVSITNRTERFFEEAIELVQSLKMSEAEAHQMVADTYSRPVGEIRQEIGGVGTTFALLCRILDADLDHAVRTEYLRIFSLPPEYFRKKRAKRKR